MPAVSKAQFGKMGAMYSRGEISRKTLEKFNRGVDPDKLPDHAPKRNPLEGTRQRRKK